MKTMSSKKEIDPIKDKVDLQKPTNESRIKRDRLESIGGLKNPKNDFTKN